MQAIYEAVRDIIYPKNRANATGRAFDQGINSYRVTVREALADFERLNRGHRHLLGKPELSLEHAGRVNGPYSDPANRARRATLRDSTYRLAAAIISGYPQTPIAPMKKLLVTVDTEGWLQHFAKGKIYEMCLHSRKLGLDKDFYLLGTVKADNDIVTIDMVVHDSMTSLVSNSFKLTYRVNTNTFKGVFELLILARADLEKKLVNVANWPEFASRDAAIAAE